MTYSLYWIHTPNSSIEKDGYVGITSNLNKRLAQHRRKPPNPHFRNAIKLYGWDCLIKEIVFFGLSKEEAETLEFKLRPLKRIGWNSNEGGIAVPSYKGVKSTPETCKKISDSKIGTNNPSNKLSPDQIILIYQEVVAGVKSVDIARRYAIADTTVAKIKYLKKRYYKEVITNYLRK